MSIFKKSYTKPIPTAAQILTVKGQCVARWKDRWGRTRTAPLNKKRTRIVLDSSKWYIRLKDSNGHEYERPGYTDRRATEVMYSELMIRAERSDIGLSDALDEHKRRPLAEHISDFERHLEAKDNSEDYVDKTVSRLQRLTEGCGFSHVHDLDRNRVERWLADRRSTDRRFGISTSNHYVRAIRGFCRWLEESRRIERNSMSGLKTIAKQTDVRHVRRVLTEEQLSKLLENTTLSERTYRGLNGADRAMLYELTIFTAFRAKELASLTPTSFDLDADLPTVTVAASYTKSKQRREDEQVLHPTIATHLKRWLAAKPNDRLLWPGTWYKRAFDMISQDLLDAGIPYRDSEGRVADFHALRSVAITRGARAGMHVKELQQFARHCDPNLTIGTYTRFGLVDLAGAVRKLPPLPAAKEHEEAEAVAATGTEDGSAQDTSARKLAPMLALDTDATCHSMAHDGKTSMQAGQGCDDRKPLKNQEVDTDRQPLATSVSNAGGRTRTSNLGLMNPSL